MSHETHWDGATRELIARAEARGAERERARILEAVVALPDNAYDYDEVGEWWVRSRTLRALLAEESEGCVPCGVCGGSQTRGWHNHRVHNHPPYDPACNERRVGDLLRGACLNDDGSEDTEPPSDVTEDEVAEVVAEHADCRMNDSRDGLYDSAVTTGEDVWSCGVRIPFSDDLDVAGRAHLARAILAAFHVTRRDGTR